MDWQVFRHLMRDQEVLDAIAAAAKAATQDADAARVVVDKEPLRFLDAALWCSVTMHDPVAATV